MKTPNNFTYSEIEGFHHFVHSHLMLCVAWRKVHKPEVGKTPFRVGVLGILTLSMCLVLET